MHFLSRTHPKTCFVTKSSEKAVVKAGGGKGSEAYCSTSRTHLPIEDRDPNDGVAGNVDPRSLQPIAVERGFGMSSTFLVAVGYTTQL